MPEFKEWLKQKEEASKDDQRASRLEDWQHAYTSLIDQITAWLQEDGAEHITTREGAVRREEQDLGSYALPKLKIKVGDDSVEVLPIARNVVGHVGIPALRAAGRVDITNGSRKYALYRDLRDGRETWYVVDEGAETKALTKKVFEDIIMDLMS